MNALQIRDTIQAINKREKNIEEFEARAFNVCTDWLNEVALQGKDLISIKASMRHGEWLPLFENRITLSYERANRYMRVARNINQLGDLNTAGSLRQALALIAERSESQNGNETQCWPSHIEAISRASKFVGYIEQHPLEQWPQEGIQRLREQFLPMATKLWPDKFI